MVKLAWEAVGILGLGLVLYGLFLVWPPLAFIGGGGVLVKIGVAGMKA